MNRGAAGLPALRDLTIPEEGSGAARGVLSRALGRLVADIKAALRLSPRLAEVVAPALAENPGALVSALRSPTVGTLVRCLRSRLDVMDELTALLALELARTGALRKAVRLEKAPARMISLAGRFVLTRPPGCSAVVIENGRVGLEDAGGVRWSGLDEAGGRDCYAAIEGDIALALVDNNPLAMVEAHPDKEGNAVDLGGRSPDAWADALRGALALVERHLPALRGEIDLFIHQVVPVGWYEEKHLSASYQEDIGTIYMSLHPSPMTMVEALIHEFSHNKLNALFELDDVLENAWRPLYTSPVRPDPRPLHGVLLAVHAFLPVARLYEKMIEAGAPESQSAAFHERFAQIRRVNREGADVVLTNGRPTTLGAGLFDEIRRWDAYYARWDGQ